MLRRLSGDLERLLRATPGFGQTGGICEIAYLRKQGDIAIRFNRPCLPADLIVQNFVCPAWAESHVFVGHYLNIRLDPARTCAALLTSPQEPERLEASIHEGRPIIVEHTSLTPAYPINIATARSTVIGDTLLRLFRAFGLRANAHFWIDDAARQLDAASTAMMRKGLTSSTSISRAGKPDHVVGRAFAEHVMRDTLPGPTFEAALRRMFPFAGQPPTSEDSETTADKVRRSTCCAVVTGWRQTLSMLHAQVDSFDVDTEIDFGNKSDEKPTYIERISRYYGFHLASGHDVITVVPQSQEYQTEQAREILSRQHPEMSKRVVPVYFGEVIVNGSTDRIKSARFHSVDGAVDEIGRLWKVSEVEAALALRWHLLLHRNRDPCELLTAGLGPNSFGSLHRVLSFLASPNRRTERTGSYSESELEILRLAVSLELAARRSLIDCDPSHLARWTQRLIICMDRAVRFDPSGIRQNLSRLAYRNMSWAIGLLGLEAAIPVINP